MNLIYTLDLIGTLVFAISGTLTAANKRFDIFGAFVIAFVTAVGGGTIRDILIGSHPVGWMKDLNYLVMIAAGVVLSTFFSRYIQRLRKTLFLFDTIGIGLFTVLGLQKTLSFDVSPVIAIMMGAVSAVFGGVVRDVLCTEIPLIFPKRNICNSLYYGRNASFIIATISIKYSPKYFNHCTLYYCAAAFCC